MRDPLLFSVGQFLRRYQKSSKPLLLGLSGGPDSLALFYTLVHYYRKGEIFFSVAHFDHGWREESAREAKLLQLLARSFRVPFHTERCTPSERGVNLEEEARNQRLRFFSDLCRKENYQAVVLGHHADDQQETVLKRVLETGHLPSLIGMEECMQRKEMVIWRPLLSFHKEEIQRFLKTFGIAGFSDPTNNDVRFLRARMREEMLPFLSKTFGKKLGSSLRRISQEAKELHTYLQARIAHYLNRKVVTPMGIYLDLSEGYPVYSIELRFLIELFCKQGKIFLSRSSIDSSVKIVYSNESGRELHKGERVLHIDRRRLFIAKRENVASAVLSLKEGEGTHGCWTAFLSSAALEEIKPITGWKEGFGGLLQLSLPEGEYTLALARSQDRLIGGERIADWWSKHKVPFFLRKRVPVVYREGVIVHEFLSGKCLSEATEKRKRYCLRLEWK